MKKRGFEVITSYLDKSIVMPARKTAFSAGYDLAAAEDTVLTARQVTIVPTGLKVYMPPDEYLGIHIRSGMSIKNAISLINGQGIIDADYYNNQDNEGHIMIAFYNYSDRDFSVKQGDRIAQGIFYKYLTADGDDEQDKTERTGGFGSTKGF